MRETVLIYDKNESNDPPDWWYKIVVREFSKIPWDMANAKNPEAHRDYMIAVNKILSRWDAEFLSENSMIPWGERILIFHSPEGKTAFFLELA